MSPDTADPGQAHRFSGDRLRTVINNAPIILWAIDSKGVFTFSEGQGLTLLGLAPGQLVGQSMFDVYAGEPQIAADAHRALAGETFTSRTTMGGLVFETNNAPLRDEEGRIVGAIGAATDITWRQAAEAERERLITAIEQATEDIIITDIEGAIVYVNPAFEKITGYTREEVTGQNPRILKSGGHDTAFYRQLWATIGAGKVWTGRLINRRKDGRMIQQDASISPIRDNRGHIVGYVAVRRDISRQLLIEAQLRQAQKMEAIGTLAGGIAHDFNNILSAIIGYTEIALQDIGEDSPARRSLRNVLKASDRASDLVRQILAFSRQSEQEPRPVQVKSIVKEALKLLRATLPTTIVIRPQIQSDDTVMADPTQVHQVLMNLAANAQHAMRETGGVLEVSLTADALDPAVAARHPDLPPGRYLRLRVRDTGTGIAPDSIERIFDPFFTTKAEGTGMGLSVVHGIVKGCGGTIALESELGVGSTFDVYLPAIEITAEAAPASEPPPRVGTERILFVDDEAIQVDVNQQVLSRLGYRVTAFTDSLEACTYFSRNPDAFDLVITDMTMPGMTGEVLARRLMAIRPDIPVILCTGYSEVMTKEKAEALGIRGFALKPIILRELSRILREVLDGDR